MIVAHGSAAPPQHVRLGPASGRRGLRGGGAGPPGMVGPRPQRSLHLPTVRASLRQRAWNRRIDPARVGLMGFSAGGLATLLSAAGDPGPGIWVGLDPVDHNGMGAKAAPSVKCHALVLTSEPSACNGREHAQHHRRPAPMRTLQYRSGGPRRRRVANRPDSRSHLWRLDRRRRHSAGARAACRREALIIPREGMAPTQER